MDQSFSFSFWQGCMVVYVSNYEAVFIGYKIYMAGVTVN